MQFTLFSSKSRHIMSTAVIGAIIAAGLAAPSLLGRGASGAPVATPAPEAKESMRLAYDLSAAFKQAAKTVAPSVVHITCTVHAKANAATADTPDNPSGNDLFRHFFGDGSREFRFGMPPTPQPHESSGEATGLIIRDDGFIVTNNHVVNGADEISVKLDNNREFSATVVGTDADSDLAVIKIDVKSLKPAALGDSSVLEAGEWVVAIGNPFGYDHTVTAGIISATGRGAMGLATFGDFIQTDAAINPGNSGGPLVTLDGKVIGINTAISTRTGGSMGVGFAIPSNMVDNIVRSIIDTGKVARGWLGVSIQPLDADLAKSYDFQSEGGALIAEVLPDTPAAKAGLKAEDIVTSFNHKPVNNSNDLLNAVAATPPGKAVTVDVFRKGKPEQIEVTLAERPSQDKIMARAPGGGNGRTTSLGMSVEPLTREMARELDVPAGEGVVVSEVEDGSLAARAGIEPGDVITQLGDTRIRTVEDFTAALNKQKPGEAIRLQLRSQGMSRFLMVKPGR